jgi:hypothetical protein
VGFVEDHKVPRDGGDFVRLPEEAEEMAAVTRLGLLKRKLAELWSSVTGV